MPQIAVPLEFFRKERDTGYSHWPTAFWRELVSNLLDADATECHVTIGRTPCGNDVQLTIEDNGRGMTQSICENIYLSIGRSTKDGSASVGGFGRARILTCFAMKSYEVHGYGYIVKGAGADYKIIPGPERTNGGLKLVIVPDQNPNWLDHLTTVLEQSHLPGLKVFVNGKQHYFTGFAPTDGKMIYTRMRAEKLQPKDLIGAAEEYGAVPNTNQYVEVPMGTVYFNETTHQYFSTGYLYVRISGMIMFERYVALSKGFAVLELNPNYSREWLTANRDGMKTTAWPAVDAVVEDIKKEGKRAVKQSAIRVKEWFGSGYPVRIAGKMPDGAGRAYSNPFGAENSTGKTAITKHAESYFNEPMFFHISTISEQAAAVADLWRPAYRTPSMERFFKSWVSACELAVDAFLTLAPDARFAWMPGLSFSDSARAMHLEMSYAENTVHALCINPLNMETLGLRYNLNVPRNKQDIWASAIHEVSHIAFHGHDADYAAFLTDMFSVADLMKFRTSSKVW